MVITFVPTPCVKPRAPLTNLHQYHYPLFVQRARCAISATIQANIPSPSDGYNQATEHNPISARDLRNQSHTLWRKYPEPCASPLQLEPHHWINLTNGLEMLPCFMLASAPSNVRFTRIQSSHCESSSYEKLLSCLDNDFLLSLAVGRPCYVYDLASRNKLRGVSRALFLGLQFIRWALTYLWFGMENVPTRVLVRGKNVVPFWRDIVLPYRISKDTKKRIRYFMPYAYEMNNRSVHLHGVYGKPTEIDGCIRLHIKFLRQWLEDVEQRRKSQQNSDINPDVPDNFTPGDEMPWYKDNGLVVYDSDSTCDQLRDIQKAIKRTRWQE